MDELGQVLQGSSAQWNNQATPNPRLRKQVRRSPDDEGAQEGDVEMASPTKAKRAAPATIGRSTSGRTRGRKTRERGRGGSGSSHGF